MRPEIPHSLHPFRNSIRLLQCSRDVPYEAYSCVSSGVMDGWGCTTCLRLQILVWDGYPALFPATLWTGVHCESVLVSLQYCRVFPMRAKQLESISRRSLGCIMIVYQNLTPIFRKDQEPALMNLINSFPRQKEAVPSCHTHCFLRAYAVPQHFTGGLVCI